MRKLKMQVAMLALALAAVIAAKIYVDRALGGGTRQTVVSEAVEPGTVSLPEPEKKM